MAPQIFHEKQRPLVPILTQRFFWIPARILFFLFLRYKVEGKEHLRALEKMERKNGVIFAANHTGEWDPVFVNATLPFFSRLFPLRFGVLEKQYYKKGNLSLFSIFYGGLLFKMLGSRAIAKGKKNYDEALAPLVEILNAGGSLVYFPEGRINRTGVRQPAHGGVGYLVWKTKAIVLPVEIRGVYHLSFADFFLGRRRATVVIKKPIFPQELFLEKKEPSPEECKQIAEQIMLRILPEEKLT